MTTYKVQNGGSTVAITEAKSWVSGTGSLFSIRGPVQINALFGRLTVATPSADIIVRFQFSSSLGAGLSYLTAEGFTFFTIYPVGTTITLPATAGSSPVFNAPAIFDVAPSAFCIGPGTIQFLANDATPATQWYCFYTPLHPTSSVIPL